VSDSGPDAKCTASAREPIVVVPYDSDWPRQFQREAAAIRAALGALLQGIEHVGSTAVPGLAAKPIIDLIAYVPAFQDGFACVEPLVALGYQSEGEYGIDGRHYFRRYENGVTTHHLHMYASDDAPVRDEIVFRNFLLAHPDIAREYATLKYALAARHRHERVAYTNAKTDFITDVLRRATASQP
jgi:GrpB-like predicted nucleotidyltransferase (UPF0157 family)